MDDGCLRRRTELTGKMFFPESYTIISNLFPRFLGMIYFFAFCPFIFQIRGLIGEEGILPAKRFLSFFKQSLGSRCYYRLPTVFWVDSSDRMLVFVPVLGTILSLFLMLGFAPSLILALLIVLHLSIVTVGQDFLGFGWEGYLVELGYHAFLMSLTMIPNIFVWVSLGVYIFRMHLQAGTCKFQSGDPCWKNFTALNYHYQTQPIPNMVAWYFHKFPEWFHKLSVWMMLGIEIVVPFLVFGPELFRLFAFVCFFGLQFFIWVSGNYSFLNHLTAVTVTLLISNTFLEPFFSVPLVSEASFISLLISIPGIGLLTIQALALWSHFFKTPKLSQLFHWLFPYHLGNRFGIFGVMTTIRYEIIVEGSIDGEEWKEYYFWFKPSETNRRPRRIAPFQPRIDWQAWFLPFGEYEGRVWFQNFLLRILEGSAEVVKLLRYNPFPKAPPKYLRAQLYIYEFSDWKTRKETSQWWVRRYIGPYTPEPIQKFK